MPDMKLSNRIAYAPIDALLHIIALLPLGVLYVISDCIFVILFHIVRYRRKVVGNNLRESFPEKSDAELSKIECRFYHFLCDYFYNGKRNLFEDYNLNPNDFADMKEGEIREVFINLED